MISDSREKGMVHSKGDPMEDNFGVASDWISSKDLSRYWIHFRLCLMSSLWLKVEHDGCPWLDPQRTRISTKVCHLYVEKGQIFGQRASWQLDRT